MPRVVHFMYDDCASDVRRMDVFDMTLFTPTQHRFAQAVADLSYCNPFLPERIELERAALGDAFDESSAVWSKQIQWQEERSNVTRINDGTDQLVTQVHELLGRGERGSPGEFELYEDLVNYLLYQRYRRQLAALIDESLKGPPK